MKSKRWKWGNVMVHIGRNECAGREAILEPYGAKIRLETDTLERLEEILTSMGARVVQTCLACGGTGLFTDNKGEDIFQVVCRDCGTSGPKSRSARAAMEAFGKLRWEEEVQNDSQQD